MDLMTEHLLDHAWSDVEVIGISWIEEGRDVAFHIRRPTTKDGKRPDATLVCRWAEALTVNVVYLRGRGGHLLTWDVQFTKDPENGWMVAFDFGEQGELRLVCSEIELLP